MEKFRFIPEDQRVLVLPEKKEEGKTKSGIIIPTQVTEDMPLIGQVIAVGRGDADRPMRFNVGDTIVTSSYSGVEVELNLEGAGFNTYKVMNQMDIMGKLKKVE